MRCVLVPQNSLSREDTKGATWPNLNKARGIVHHICNKRPRPFSELSVNHAGVLKASSRRSAPWQGGWKIYCIVVSGRLLTTPKTSQKILKEYPTQMNTATNAISGLCNCASTHLKAIPGAAMSCEIMKGQYDVLHTIVTGCKLVSHQRCQISRWISTFSLSTHTSSLLYVLACTGTASPCLKTCSTMIL